MNINELLNSLAGPAQQVVSFREATKPINRTLSTAMASLFGRRTRKTVPVLATAVEALSSKLFVRQVGLDSATATKTLKGWLSANGWNRLERLLWEAVIRDGRAFVLVTWDPQRNIPRLTFRPAYDGTQGAALLGDGGPAVNIYTMGETRCVDLFYPDRVEKYQFEISRGDWLPRRDAPGEAWPLEWTDANGEPLGTALIAFGDGGSAIGDALQVQADLNETLLDLQATSRSQGWPQRVVSGDDGGILKNIHGQPVKDSQGNPVKRDITLEPGSILRLDGKDAKLSQLDGARLDRTLVDVHLELISLLTTVPSHYFTGDWPSGVALLTAEQRLNTKVEDYQGELSSPLESAITLMLRLADVYGEGGLPRVGAVSVEWFPPQVETEDLVRDREKATLELYKGGLLSLETALARIHPDWSEEAIAEEVGRLRPMPTGRTLQVEAQDVGAERV
jgi:hypothetical protein